LAWKVSNETFLADNDGVNNLNPPFGLGAVGNQNVEDYVTLQLWPLLLLLGNALMSGNTANPDFAVGNH
jgi:hypothetical protein